MLSDCREQRPFYPQLEGTVLGTLQIPTTLPPSDELLALGGMKEHALADYYLGRLKEYPVNILGLHAEIEGLKYLRWLRLFPKPPCIHSAIFSSITRTMVATSSGSTSQVFGREPPEGDYWNAKRNAPRENFLGLGCPKKIPLPWIRYARLPGMAPVAILNQADVARDGPTPNIVEELPLVEAVKKIFQHGSLPSSLSFVLQLTYRSGSSSIRCHVQVEFINRNHGRSVKVVQVSRES
jgi:hypothetical protein